MSSRTTKKTPAARSAPNKRETVARSTPKKIKEDIRPESSDDEAPVEVRGSAGLRAAAELAEREEQASIRHAEEKRSKNRARTQRQQETAAERRKTEQKEVRKQEEEVDRLPAQLLAEVLEEERLEREAKQTNRKKIVSHQRFDSDDEDDEGFDLLDSKKRDGPALGRRSGPVTVVSYEEMAANDLVKSQAAAVESFLKKSRTTKRSRTVTRSDIAKGRPDPRFTSRPLSVSKALPENAWRKKKGSKGKKPRRS